MSGDVLKQLRYSGMMEAIRIRREGYAFREDHESFVNRFSVLLTASDLDGDNTGIVPLVKALSKHLHVTGVDWQIGHSKIFLRRELAEKLDRLAKLRVHVAARTLTKFGRRVVCAQLSRFLVTWMKFRLHMTLRQRKHYAASRVASLVRRFRRRQEYIRTRRAIITIQACQRARLASRRVKKIIDPFYDLTFKECKQLLLQQQQLLEEAVAVNEFRRAADLEAMMYVRSRASAVLELVSVINALVIPEVKVQNLRWKVSNHSLAQSLTSAYQSSNCNLTMLCDEKILRLVELFRTS